MKFSSRVNNQLPQRQINGAEKLQSEEPISKPVTVHGGEVLPPVKCVATGNSLYNSLYNEQSSPYRQRKIPDSPQQTGTASTQKSSSYRLRQEDVGGSSLPDNNSYHTNSNNSSRDNSQENTLETTKDSLDRVSKLTLEQQILRGHKRTGSQDIKFGHTRTASSGSIQLLTRDRSDSQRKIVPADFIRKGSFAMTESKLQRRDSDQRQQPDVTQSQTNPLVIDSTNNQPKILVDHIPMRTSIHAPVSPSLSRSDSCNNEINPVLRGKNLQARRQVVSAMHLDLGIGTGSSNSSEDYDTSLDGERSRKAYKRTRPATTFDHHSECVIKWKKGNLLGKGSFGKVRTTLLIIHLGTYLICLFLFLSK